jgi:hypothetical protein
MKRTALLFTSSAITSIVSIAIITALSAVGCKSNDDSGSDEGTVAEGDASASASGATADGVDCVHPGAGKKLETGKCECKSTHTLTGAWSMKRTCREDTACPARNVDEEMTFTQNGADVTGESSRLKITGVLCGDYLLWTGAAADGTNPECGQFKFTDDNHFLRDSCYVGNGECQRTYSTGCKDQKGQCVGTGARRPEGAPNIQKQLCL